MSPLPCRFASLMLIGMSAPIPSLVNSKRRWLQFSLRTALVVVTAICVALSTWLVPAERQRQAVAALRAVGASVSYSHDLRNGEAAMTPLQRWLPTDYLAKAEILTLRSPETTDAPLTGLSWLSGLKHLDLVGTPIGHTGVARLASLTSLQKLVLARTNVTDADLAQLGRLTNLQVLNLADTPVTGAGLVKLKGLVELRELDLGGSQITDDALANLSAFVNLQVLFMAAAKSPTKGWPIYAG